MDKVLRTYNSTPMGTTSSFRTAISKNIITGALLSFIMFTCKTSSASTSCSNYGWPGVCHSILKVANSEIINDAEHKPTRYQDSYCNCNACPYEWTSGDNVLTWYHHQRNDWQVQYQFCQSVIPTRRCTSYENSVATIRVNNSHWQPFLIKMNCHCAADLYHLKGWMFEKDEEWWDYTYECYQPICELGDTCVRHYMDRGQSRTLGYQFLCSCPEGFQCPIAKEGVRIQSLTITDQDQTGPYKESPCEPIRGWNSDQTDTEPTTS